MAKKKKNPKAEAKAAAKKAALELQLAKSAAIKAAVSNADPLAALPPMFAAYNRNGLTATISHHTAEGLSKPDCALRLRLSSWRSLSTQHIVFP